MNKVIIMGRLTADPELRQTQSGIASCRFTVAVNRRFADRNTGERQADFISCTAWRQTAEFVSRYFKKGSMICVEGSLRTGSYTDRNHPDVTHYTTDVFVDNVEFTGSKAESGTGGIQLLPVIIIIITTIISQLPSSRLRHRLLPSNDNMSYGNLSDFEEILSDGDVPF